MPTTIQSLLEELKGYARSPREQGDLFERLVANYLVADPLYKDRFSDVWLWNEWPGRRYQVVEGVEPGEG